MQKHKRRRERVLGPYRERNHWRLIIINRDGERTSKTCESKEEAEKLKAALQKEIRRDLHQRALELQEIADRAAADAERVEGRGLTLEQALEQYEGYLLRERGNKPETVVSTLRRMRGIFGDTSIVLVRVTSRKAEQMYKAVTERWAVDTHRNALGQAKTFWRWLAKRKWVRPGVFDDVEPIGKRKRGKMQLNLTESKKLFALALEQARGQGVGQPPWAKQRQESGLAIALDLCLGFRPGEIVGLQCRDVDAGQIWVRDGKTHNSERRVKVPKVLRELLEERVREREQEGGRNARVFPHRCNWIRLNAHRLCRLADLPMISGHSLRGMHATLAIQAGATGDEVARQLGHGDFGVTKAHYTAPWAVENATLERAQTTMLGTTEADPTSQNQDEKPAEDLGNGFCPFCSAPLNGRKPAPGPATPNQQNPNETAKQTGFDENDPTPPN